MKRFLFSLCVLCALCGGVFAQTVTTVSGTVRDGNGVPYAAGTIMPQFLNVSGGASPTITATGAPLFPPVTPYTLDATGTFSFGLMANGSISPAATQWQFLICSAPTAYYPNAAAVAQCFTVGPITIASATQSITTNINALAVPLLMPTTVAFAGASGGTGLSQVVSQRILSNGTTIAPGTAQAQTSLTITGLTTNSACFASVPDPLPNSWRNGIDILPVVVTTNTATVWLQNASTSLVTPVAIAVNIKCII